MRKLMLFFVCISLFCFYGKSQISIHTNQVERFHDLMRYSEEKAGGKLNCKRANEVELQVIFDKNANDSRLNALIDSLLNTSVLYSPEVIKNVSIRQLKEAKGKEAYRIALTIFPDFCMDITAGMTSIWMDYWNSEYRYRTDNIVTQLKTNKNELIEIIETECKALLPDGADMNIEINIHIIVDGNRGSFQFDNNAMMDMAFGDFGDFSVFVNVLKHEMHHAYYGKWLAEKMSNKERNEIENYFYEFQKSFLFEGIAQRYTHKDLSAEVKQMYANKELITELFDEWISLIREVKGNSPLEAFSTYQNNEFDSAVERLKKYYPGNKDSIEYPHRPNFTYYLSYNIYNSIFESGGQEKLKYVIENPDKLLLVYNELHTNSAVVPKIPNDIVMLWQENF